MRHQPVDAARYRPWICHIAFFEFVLSIIESFKAHWKTFHAWNGSEPTGRQVHLWQMNGADTALIATATASGFYLE